MISFDDILLSASGRRTPFYLYDMGHLHRTIAAVKKASAVNNKFRVHYAMKACNDAQILKYIQQEGLCLDTVSGNEIALGLKIGFSGDKILFAGVGKSDEEIDLALSANIEGFNVESLPELEVISQRAARLGTIAKVSLRVNPEIDAHTHHFITTGLAENKFGINLPMLDKAIDLALSLPNIEFKGLHFHIGSQITITEPFEILCGKVNDIVSSLEKRGVEVKSLNMGGGLGVDYMEAFGNKLPDFRAYFDIFAKKLNTAGVNEVHFELGRSVVAQCGYLITKVLYVKEGVSRTFAIVDGGITELIRPALYGARHPIVNISGELRNDKPRNVDIVGPVCESSDVFGSDYTIASPRRGDILAVCCAGAYGEVMSSRYNCRELNPSVHI